MAIVYFPEFPAIFNSLVPEARLALVDARFNGSAPSRWYEPYVKTLEQLDLVEIEKKIISVPLWNGKEKDELFESFSLTEDGKLIVKKVQFALTAKWQELIIKMVKRIENLRDCEWMYYRDKKLLRSNFERPIRRLLVREYAIDYISSRMDLILNEGCPLELKGLPPKGAWVFGVLAGVMEEGVPAAFFRRYFAVKAVMELSKRKLIEVASVKSPKYILTDLGKQLAITYCEEPKEEVEPEEDDEDTDD